ncbi:MAG TPA: hypothetical protein VNQ34_07230 [Xanthobacteraceae bacterium]|nr:hypothetical protein [Xanthobacteraceae bacterium]
MVTITMMGGKIVTTDDGMTAAEEKAARDRIRGYWKQGCEKLGKQEMETYLVSMVGAKNPGQILDGDLDVAETYLKAAVKIGEPKKTATIQNPEGLAPEGFAANIRAKFNSPRARNPISGEVTELPDGTPVITLEKPDEEATRSPRPTVDDPINPPRKEPNIIESDPEARAPVGTFGKRRPVNTAGKTEANLKGDLADEIWKRHHEREKQRKTPH